MASKILMSCFAVLVLCYLVNADERAEIRRALRTVTPCTISMNCPTIYDICHERKCRWKTPCNKDNDCFFYAAADIANGAPHPKCYKILGDGRVPFDYGYCMLKERVGHLPNLLRLKGKDVDSLDEHPIDTSNMQ